MDNTANLERNIPLFLRFKAVSSVLPWLPIFFLYFIERVSLNEAILLGSASYFTVFLLEVPSGYFSDRYGRRPILVFAALMATMACALFLMANSFFLLLLAQVLLASRIAFQSGSDSALLYDSLCCLGRESEYTQHEIVAQKWSMLFLASSCLIGGALATIDLRLPYFIGLIASVVALILCLKFTEPPAQNASKEAGVVAQIRLTVWYFNHPLLRWLLLFFMLSYSLEHIPYEFYQPYLKLLSVSEMTGYLRNNSAPLISATVMSISMFGGAIGAMVSQKLISVFGLRSLLISSVFIQLFIIAGMSLLLHPTMLVLVMFRNFAMSMTHGPMLGAIAPHITSDQRATFLSILSLCGRAAFAIVLASVSLFFIGDGELNWEALKKVLLFTVVVGGVLLISLYFWAVRIQDSFV